MLDKIIIWMFDLYVENAAINYVHMIIMWPYTSNLFSFSLLGDGSSDELHEE